jgi:Tol biopolymer transport system component
MKYPSGKRRARLFGQPPQRPPFLPISLVVLAIIIYLLSLVTPSNLTAEILQPLGVVVPSATPSATPLPGPTPLHGGHIVFTCTRKDINQICIINADGTGYQQLTNNITNTYYPAISPDGKQILFVNKAAEGPSSLWAMGRTGENPHLLYAGPNTIVGAAWSPDGNTVAIAMSVDSPYTFEIFLLNLKDLKAQPRRLSHGLSGIGGSIDWSPDGKNLLIFAGPVAAREIYRLDVATGNATQLTFGGNNAAASYSPDGQWIVFNSLRNNNQADLYIIRADGHLTRQLTSDSEPDWQPKWGP